MNKNVIPNKFFGQHFLINKHIINEICNFTEVENNYIIEIGPGTGNLTEFILNRNPKLLIAIEKDKKLIPLLKDKFKNFQNFILLNEDATKIDINKICKILNINDDIKFNVVSNLPYNVGTIIIMQMYNAIKKINKMIFMLQKEVVERIIAKDSCKEYGKISILFQFLYQITLKMQVSPNNFLPKPKVVSAIIEMTPKNNDIDPEFYNFINNFCNICFQNRRKIIKNLIRNTIFEDFVNYFENSHNLRIENIPYTKIIEVLLKIYKIDNKT